MYLDGGTILVKVYVKGQKEMYFGLDNPSEFFAPNSKGLTIEQEKLLIEKHNKVEVFVNGLLPDSKNAVLLPFKGKLESKLKSILTDWLTCKELRTDGKEALKEFIDEMNSIRLRKVLTESSPEWGRVGEKHRIWHS